MGEAAETNVDLDSELQEPKSQAKFEIMDAASFAEDPSNLTLLLYEEDHTIGNSLKHILCHMEDVEFCGYNVPHPLEDKILLRVQTKNGKNALPIVLKALEDLEQIFATMRRKFRDAYSRAA